MEINKSITVDIQITVCMVCNISYCERKEVNNKVNKFPRMCGTMSRTLKGKTQLSTEMKFYKVMAVPVLIRRINLRC